MICGASYKKPVSCVATGHRRGSQADSLSGLVMSDRFAGFLVYMIGFMLKRKNKICGSTLLYETWSDNAWYFTQNNLICITSKRKKKNTQR